MKLILITILTSLLSISLFAGQEGGDGGVLVNVNGRWVNLDEARNYSEMSFFGIREVIEADCGSKSNCTTSTYGKAALKWMEEFDKLIPGYKDTMIRISDNVEFRFVNNELAWEPDKLPDQVVDYKQYKKAAIYRAQDGNNGRVYISIPVMKEMGSVTDRRMNREEGQGYLLLHELFNIAFKGSYSAQEISDVGNTFLTAYYSKGNWDTNRFLERLGKLGINSLYFPHRKVRERILYLKYLLTKELKIVFQMAPFRASESIRLYYMELKEIYDKHPEVFQLIRNSGVDEISLSDYLRLYDKSKEEFHGALMAISALHIKLLLEDESFNFSQEELNAAIVSRSSYFTYYTLLVYTYADKNCKDMLCRAVTAILNDEYEEAYKYFMKEVSKQEVSLVESLWNGLTRQFKDQFSYDLRKKRLVESEKKYFFFTTDIGALPKNHLVKLHLKWNKKARIGVEVISIELFDGNMNKLRDLSVSDIFHEKANKHNQKEMLKASEELIAKGLKGTILFAGKDGGVCKKQSSRSKEKSEGCYPVKAYGNLKEGLVQLPTP